MHDTPPCPLCNSSDPRPVPMPPDTGRYFHCMQCDLRFLHPGGRLAPSDEHARYMNHENDASNLGYRKFLEPLFQAMDPRLVPGQRGLDFGAGPSSVLAEIFAQGGYPEVAVYDPFFAPDPRKLAVTYDFVVCSEAAEHFYNPAKEFEVFFKLLKPGGYLGLMTLLANDALDFASWYYRRDPTHVVFYSRRSFAWIAEHYGFEELLFHSERVVTLRRPVVSK